MRLEDMMTKTIEEQIEEARYEHFALSHHMDASTTQARLLARATSRLATLEAVRDGRAIPVYATVRVDRNRAWEAYGWFDAEPLDERVLEHTSDAAGDMRTILRGYAHVPSTQVHEVEADSEVTL